MRWRTHGFSNCPGSLASRELLANPERDSCAQEQRGDEACDKQQMGSDQSFGTPESRKRKMLSSLETTMSTHLVWPVDPYKVAATREGMCAHVVSMISARTGWFVDCVRFCMSDGMVKSWGGDGGMQVWQYELRAGEYIERVEQVNQDKVGYLGSCLVFHLSSSRQIHIRGTRGQRRKGKVRMYRTRKVGEQIDGLVFNDGLLTGCTYSMI